MFSTPSTHISHQSTSFKRSGTVGPLLIFSVIAEFMSRSLAVLVMCWLLCQLHNPADISLWYWREDDEIALPETKVKEITAARKCEILPKRLRWAGMNCCHEMKNWGFGSNFSAFVLRPFLLITLLVSTYVSPSLILPQTVNHSREVDDYLL